MEANRPIEGRVAQVLNERELVINLGARDLVRKGMRFAVLAAKPLEIRDPETNEVLGEVDREKVRVEAIEVQERLTVCATYETQVVGGGLGMPDVTELFGPTRTVKESFRASSHPSPLSEEESFIKIGDRVKRING